MFNCCGRNENEYDDPTGTGDPSLQDTTDLYLIIEDSIYRNFDPLLDVQKVINEIFFYTKFKVISSRHLSRILKTFFRNHEYFMKLFSENFLFISEPVDYVEQLRQSYNDFNIELIILSVLNLLPNDKNKLEVFIDHIKDISFALPDKPGEIKFSTMSIVYFLMIYCGKSNMEQKAQLLFNILNSKSSTQISANDNVTKLTEIFTRMSMFFIDIEFNARLKQEALNLTNKILFSTNLLEDIIFYKKILTIYLNFGGEVFQEMVMYFVHNMIISIKKSQNKIKFAEFTENLRKRKFDAFIPKEQRKFIMDFFAFNKKFFNVLISSIKQFILHFESVYDQTCSMEQPKPKITNPEYIIEFNMTENLKILENVLKKADYYHNIFKKDFFKKKKEADEVTEMLVTSSLYSKPSLNKRKSVLSSSGFKSGNVDRKSSDNLYFRSETKDFNNKSLTPSPTKFRPNPSPEASSLNLRTKISSATTKYKPAELEVIPEQQELQHTNIEKERVSKLKIKRIINRDNALSDAAETLRKTEESKRIEEVDENRLPTESVHEMPRNNVEIQDIDAMLIQNDEQFRMTEANPRLSQKDLRLSTGKRPSKKDEENGSENQVNKSIKSLNNKEEIVSSNKEIIISQKKESEVPDVKQEEPDNNFEENRLEINITPMDPTPHEGVVLEHQMNNDDININNPYRESKPKTAVTQSQPSEVLNVAMRVSKPKEEYEFAKEESRFKDEKELSDIEKADNMGNESDLSKDSIFINLKTKNENKKQTPNPIDDSIFTDSEFQNKQEKVPATETQSRQSNIRESKYDPRAAIAPSTKNPFLSKKSNDNPYDNKNQRYANINEELLNQKSSKEPLDIILGQREGKANAHINESHAKVHNNDKVDLNLDSLNIVLKNKNQQSFVSNHKSNQEKFKHNNNLNNVQQPISSGENLSSKENKDPLSKPAHGFGNFLQHYFDNFESIDVRSVNMYKSGLNMLGIKTLQEKLKDKVPSKAYVMKLFKHLKAFTPNGVKDILELNMKVDMINMYFCLLQIYNDYVVETRGIERVKIYDISLFLNLQGCLTTVNFEPMVTYFKDEDVFTKYKRVIIPIYVEDNMDFNNDNLILSLFDIQDRVIYFYDAKGVLICDMNIIENYRIMFENCFRDLAQRKLISKEFLSWKTVNDEAIPDFLSDYAVAIILFIAEKLSRCETLNFDNDNNIEAELWNERIFCQIADFFVRLNKTN